MSKGIPWQLAEGFLWVTAVFCSGTLLRNTIAAHEMQVAAAQIQTVTSEKTLALPVSGVLGRLEIAGLLSVPVLANDDSASLIRGVGHMPGTAQPGGLGNLVLAGHRDTFFRPLRRVRPGMIMAVVTAAGRFRYAIDSTEIVTPDAVEITGIGDRPEMTLITCYPFDFIGAAPRRFIVHAHLLNVDAE